MRYLPSRDVLLVSMFRDEATQKGANLKTSLHNVKKKKRDPSNQE